MVFYKLSFKRKEKKKRFPKESYLIFLKAYSTWGNCSKEELRVSFKAQAASFTFSWKPRLLNPLKLTNCGRSLVFMLATAGERQRWRWRRQKRNSGRDLLRCPQLLEAVRSQAGRFQQYPLSLGNICSVPLPAERSGRGLAAITSLLRPPVT